MTPNLFNDRRGRLRSGWRLALFAAAFLFTLYLSAAVIFFPLALVSAAFGTTQGLAGRAGYLIQALAILVSATVVGWACNRFLEGLPFRALGWALHKNWLRDFLLGALFGGLSLAFAAALCAAAGSYTFSLTPAELWPSVLRTFATSGAFFLLGAACEEALFRGYPLQTLLRSWPAWLALLPSSLVFAYIHTSNPNAVVGFTFLNTALAGAWLAVAYLRTRSLWLPFGLHWGWNWTMGALLGLPVSGITWVAPMPLVRATDTGPTWLTGGHYGIEGGVVCTLALIASGIFIHRTRLLSATDELKRFTDGDDSAPSTTGKVIETHGA